MKAIIFGGTGFLGSKLAYELCKKGHSVNIVSRSKKQSTKNIEVVQWDYKNPLILKEILYKQDLVINLSGASISSLWTSKRKNSLIESRVKHTSLIVKTLNQTTQFKPKLFIQASALGYYGYNTRLHLTESESKGEGFLANLCELWENATRFLNDVPFVILRTGLVLDKDYGILPTLSIPFKLFLGGNLGKGKNYMSWIHINDWTNAILFLIEKKVNDSGPFNLCSPHPVTQNEFNSTLAKQIHRPKWLNVPSFFLNLLPGNMGKELILSNQHVIPEKLLSSGYEFEFKYIRDALEDIYS